jgi:hypothetical protein
VLTPPGAAPGPTAVSRARRRLPDGRTRRKPGGLKSGSAGAVASHELAPALGPRFTLGARADRTTGRGRLRIEHGPRLWLFTDYTVRGCPPHLPQELNGLRLDGVPAGHRWHGQPIAVVPCDPPAQPPQARRPEREGAPTKGAEDELEIELSQGEDALPAAVHPGVLSTLHRQETR